MNKIFSFFSLFVLFSFFLIFSSTLFATCNPGDRYCVDRFTMNLCKQDGSGYIPITCIGEECDFNLGGCPSFVLGLNTCNPATDSFKCQGTSSLFCDGRTWKILENCGTKGCDESTGLCYDCDKNDPSSKYCQGKYTLVSCPDGYWSSQDCRSLGQNFVCDGSKKQCVLEQQATVDCNVEGTLRCDGNNLQVCQNKKWNTLQVCPYGCDVINKACYDCSTKDTNYPYCQDNVLLVSCPDGYKETINCKQAYGENYYCDSKLKRCVSGVQECINGSKRCNDNILEQCSNNKWVVVQNCLLDPFFGCYQASPTNAYCKECSTPQQKQCVSLTSYRECLSTYLFGNEIFCPINYVCSFNGQCVPSVLSPGGGAGGGGSGRSFSGGGEVSSCKSYSEWMLNSSVEYKKENQTCRNMTYVSYCIKQDGTFDFSRVKRNYTVLCFDESQKPKICNYIYSKSVSYVDNSTGQCRNCTKDIFIYNCNGVEDLKNTKEALSCSSFYPCPEQAAETKKDQYQEFISTYGPALLFLLIIALVAVGFYLWKSSEEKQQPPKE